MTGTRTSPADDGVEGGDDGGGVRRDVRTGVRGPRRRAALVRAPFRTAVTVTLVTGVMVVTAVVGLAACSGAPAAPVPLPLTGEAQPVVTGTLAAADLSAGHTAFGLDLLHALCADAPGANVVVSPTSAALALGLLQPAAAGPSARDLADLLHVPVWSADVSAATRDLTAALGALAPAGAVGAPADDDAPDGLRVSNRVWTSTTGDRPEARYLDDVATAFAAHVQPLDFAGDPVGATDAINRAVDRDTVGMIDALLDEPLDPTTAAVLTNAVHLDARWRTPFAATEPTAFAAPAGVVAAPMMTGGSGAARRADGWTSVELPYRDGTLTAVAVLPPSGVDPCTVDAERLAALAGAEPQDAAVGMPRLDLEQTLALLPLLVRLGLPATGDYAALCGSCQVSEVVQKTALEVDEAGTEAAAATGIAMESSARAEPPASVTFDRPYLLLLADTATRSPLFVAAIQDPTA